MDDHFPTGANSEAKRMNFERGMDEVLDIVRNARGTKACALLMGAGCSVTAGILAADGVIEKMARDYPSTHASTENRVPAGYMAELGAGQGKELIGEVIEDSTINWRHIAIAQLLANDYV